MIRTYPLIAELIQRQAALSPHSVALRAGRDFITYHDLNERANQLAWHLRDMGLIPEQLVGVCIPRSFDTAIAMLGILKAGGCYVVLEPTYPVERLRHVVESAPLTRIITWRHLQGSLLKGLKTETIFTDDPVLRCSGARLDPPTTVTENDRACVVYTSGSTGSPKGVVTTHRTMSARISADSHPDMIPADVCALSSPVSFGLTASRLFVPLAVGSTVEVLPDGSTFDAVEFVSWLKDSNITSVAMAPGQLARIVRDGANLADLTHLRALTVGGAILSVDLAREAVHALPHVRLFSAYGSSELGTTAAMVEVSSADYSTVNLGLPVKNTQFYLVTPDLKFVPPGEQGEICVNSPYLAREYLHDPERTRERFVANPFDPSPDSRLFRTGDVGVRLADGSIQFIGRVDLQVKIRGVRVEPGEIEAVLKGHPAVADAVVVTRDLDDDKQLLAFTELKRDVRAIKGAELKEYLATRLPAYMVPGWIVCLDKLPLTASGKVDRGSLPPPATRALRP